MVHILQPQPIPASLPTTHKDAWCPLDLGRILPVMKDPGQPGSRRKVLWWGFPVLLLGLLAWLCLTKLHVAPRGSFHIHNIVSSPPTFMVFKDGRVSWDSAINKVVMGRYEKRPKGWMWITLDGDEVPIRASWLWVDVYEEQSPYHKRYWRRLNGWKTLE